MATEYEQIGSKGDSQKIISMHSLIFSKQWKLNQYTVNFVDKNLMDLLLVGITFVIKNLILQKDLFLKR
jgi:hypothetical protein